MPRRTLLALECAALFGGLPPLMVAADITKMSGVLLIVWGLAFICLFWMAKRERWREVWNGAAFTGENLRPILLTFGVCAGAIGLFTFLVHPEKLFSFPRTRPLWWALVMLLYPALSVLPQEILYRAFFFRRYRELFSSDRAMILVNAGVFSLCHILFHNFIAVAFTLAGGLLFARTYARTRSLALVTLEHALYGCFIFTIGLGSYFYHGAAH